MKSITLRERKGKKGTTIQLDIYEDGVRKFETLTNESGETLLLINSPQNPKEREHNRKIKEFANLKKAELEAKLLTGKFTIIENISNNADFIEYLNLYAKEKNSINYQYLAQKLSEFDGDLTFKKVNTDTFLEEFKKFLLNQEKSLVIDSTASVYFSLLKSALKIAKQRKIIKDDNSFFVDNISVKEKPYKYLEIDEIKLLFVTQPPISKYDIKTIALFSYYTLTRISDIVDLKWEHIKEIKGITVIEKEIVKTRRNKIIVIPEFALKIMPKKIEGDKYVFNLHDRPKKIKCIISAIVSLWGKKAGISKPISFHTLRHSGATEMITNGADIYSVSKQLTHSNINTTQRYAKVVVDKQSKAANLITEIEI